MSRFSRLNWSLWQGWRYEQLRVRMQRKLPSSSLRARGSPFSEKSRPSLAWLVGKESPRRVVKVIRFIHSWIITNSCNPHRTFNSPSSLFKRKIALGSFINFHVNGFPRREKGKDAKFLPRVKYTFPLVTETLSEVGGKVAKAIIFLEGSRE